MRRCTLPPLIRQAIEGNQIRLVWNGGEWLLTEAMIPAQQNTPAKVETWANNWLASNVTTCQVVVHVFSLGPLAWTVWCADLGVSVPAEWWL